MSNRIMAMLRPDNLFQIFGIILLLLASIGVIGFTSKFIFGLGRIKPIVIPQKIYDPDHGCKINRICPFTKNPYHLLYNQTVCYNKTMYYRYIPWVHFDVWRDFRQMNEEKQRRRIRKLEIIKAREYEKSTEEKQNTEEKTTEDVVIPTETPANRKVKDEPSKVVCTILAIFLIISSIVAFCEVFRDKCMTKEKTSKRMSQRFSLADAPVKDFMKESPDPQLHRQGTFQSTAKVTQSLVHQSSLDRAFSRLSSEVKPPFLRRSSVPVQMMSSGSSPSNEMTSSYYTAGYGTQTNPCISGSPDTRRKSRHFIRRH